jgi:hypothetical protein
MDRERSFEACYIRGGTRNMCRAIRKERAPRLNRDRLKSSLAAFRHVDLLASPPDPTMSTLVPFPSLLDADIFSSTLLSFSVTCWSIIIIIIT